MALYNLKTTDGEFRITKFTNDLDVESSYIVSENECGCPAGVRPTCRHRQMLPKMLAVGAEDSGMFYDFDKDQFLEPISNGEEDTQPAIVSPIEEPLEDQSPSFAGMSGETAHAVRSNQPLESTTSHPAITGTLKRRI